MKRANLILLFALSAILGLFFSACTDPDPGGEFDRYSELVGDGGGGDIDYVCETEHRDISGFYFVRLSHSVSPGQHILLSFDIEETGEDVYTIVVQPLLTDIGQDKEPREDAREPVGDAIIVEGLAPDEDGVFQLSLEEVTVDGQANSVTWSDILADMDLTITPCEDEENDIICGEGSLNLIAPPLGEQTATFGAIKVDEIDEDSKTPKSCSSLPE